MQTIVGEFLDVLKRNPNILSSVLQTAKAASMLNLNEYKGQTGLLKNPITSDSSSICTSSSSDEEAAQNGATNGPNFSADDLLARRASKGEGSEAQQTFRVSKCN